MGNSLYLIENLKVFLESSHCPLIYFKSMPKSTPKLIDVPQILIDCGPLIRHKQAYNIVAGHTSSCVSEMTLVIE